MQLRWNLVTAIITERGVLRPPIRYRLTLILEEYKIILRLGN